MNTSRTGGRRIVRLTCFAAAFLLCSVPCFEIQAKPPQPVLPALRDAAERAPVILVPGIGGTKLRESATGRIIWGNARSLFAPRDGGYRMALSTRTDDPGKSPSGDDTGKSPMTPGNPRRGTGDRPAWSELEPFEPVRQIRLLGLLKKEAYGPLERLLQKNGYRTGRLEAPGPDDSFFFLNYDWRKSVVEASGLLGRQIEDLKLARGGGELHVNLVCQSTAGLLCRWLARYGTATLEQAEAGTRRPLKGVQIDKLILLGTAGDGAVGVIEEMTRGRRYLFGIGRRWLPETLFTFPSLYESLPASGSPVFMDPSGNFLDTDVLDASSWERYEWSVYRPDVARRLERRAVMERFGDPATRRTFLDRMLDRARRLHRLLLADPPGVSLPRYYSLSGAYSMSPVRAMLVDKGDGVETVYADDRRIRKDAFLNALAHEPGDGHAGVGSQDLLSDAERAALAHPPARIAGSHFEFILSPATQRLLIEYLAE